MTPPPRRDGPSLTAQAIAAGRAIGLRDIHDPIAGEVLSDGRRRVVKALRRTIEASPTGETVINTLTAGLAGHAALRMSAVDRALLAAIEDGCRQVVVVGAGYDTRAWRLDALRDCLLVELDLPATQDRKRRRLASTDPVTPVTFVPVDLSRDTLAEALATTDHDRTRPTAWVWEAVTPYLPRAAVVETVEAIAGLSCVGSHLALTVARPELIGRGSLSTLLSPAARGLFAGMGEPLRSTFSDEDIRSLLVSHGFSDAQGSGPDDWARATGRSPLPDPFSAERLVTARR